MESRPSGFDMSTMSTASKILLGAGILYLIDLFLRWQELCNNITGIEQCYGANGMEGIGILNLLLVIALLAWEGMAIAGVNVNAPRALISAGIAAAIALFTLLKILVDNDFLTIFAWIGLILALVIGYGGWMRWQEHQATGGTTGTTGMAGTPPPPSGGFTG